MPPKLPSAPVELEFPMEEFPKDEFPIEELPPNIEPVEVF
jgi:hypothetical protein